MCNCSFKELTLYFFSCQTNIQPIGAMGDWLFIYLFIEIHSFRRDLVMLAAAASLLSLTKHPLYYLSMLQGVFNQPEWAPQLAFKANLCITKGWDV